MIAFGIRGFATEKRTAVPARTRRTVMESMLVVRLADAPNSVVCVPAVAYRSVLAAMAAKIALTTLTRKAALSSYQVMPLTA